jgi:RimJ/RimL family protein N-acetyltransferase
LAGGRRLSAPRTERLDAEAPEIGRHLDFAAAHYGDPAVARWHWPGHLGGPRTRAQVRETILRDARQLDADGFGFWWWRDRDAGELVGHVGLHRTEVEGEPAIEVGWSIAPARWGEGLAPEAAAAALAWGFDGGLDEIVSFTMVENRASQRVMQKLGLQYVREFQRQGFPHVLYRAARPGPAAAR